MTTQILLDLEQIGLVGNQSIDVAQNWFGGCINK